MTQHNAFIRTSVVLCAAGLLGAMPPLASPHEPTTCLASCRNTQASLLDTLVRLERGALDRWIRRDPDGYLDLYAADVTYFDPMIEKRLDGLAALRAHVGPIRTMKSPFTAPRYEMIAPKAQRYGSAAILTFNLVNYAKMSGSTERVLNRWNSTEVYALQGGQWKLVHSHWSFTTPAMKQPSAIP